MGVKQRATRWGGKTIPVVGIVLGVFLGRWIDQSLSGTEAGRIKLLSWTGYAGFYLNDLITTIIGLVLLFFGARIHSIVKYIGLGIVGYELGEELWEMTTGEPSF